MLQIGVPPRRIDVLNRIAGVGFDEALHDAGPLDVSGRTVPVIGLGALMRAKRAAARPQDLADVEALESERG